MRRGVTVLEVLIGTILLVICSIPVLELFGSQEHESGLIAERLLVTNHLRRQLDRLESRAVATRFRIPALAEGPMPAFVGGKSLGITIEERRELLPSDLVPGLFEARIVARWQDPTGKTPGHRELELTRLIADPERGAGHRVWPPKLLPEVTP